MLLDTIAKNLNELHPDYGYRAEVAVEEHGNDHLLCYVPMLGGKCEHLIDACTIDDINRVLNENIISLRDRIFEDAFQMWPDGIRHAPADKQLGLYQDCMTLEGDVFEMLEFVFEAARDAVKEEGLAYRAEGTRFVRCA